MEDTARWSDAPWVTCATRYQCSNQGIQRGWFDEYYVGLDCQWLDVTDLPAGNYTLQACVNPVRRFYEQSFANNCATIKVFIPASAPAIGETPVVPASWIPCTRNLDCPSGQTCNAEAVCV